MVHPFGNPDIYKTADFSKIQNNALFFTVPNLIAHFELEEAAKAEAEAKGQPFDADVFAKKLQPYTDRNDALGLIKEFKLTEKLKEQFPDIEEYLHEIALYANFTLAGLNFHKHDEAFQIDTKFARDMLKIGAQLETLYETEDKHCTVMHALMQSAKMGASSESEASAGRDTLLKLRNWITSRTTVTPATAQTPEIPVSAMCVRILSFMHGRGGHGVERSLSKAVELLEAHEKLNDPFILYDLGIAYAGLMEPGVPPEKKKYDDGVRAARYYQRAAELGHADAQTDLGLLITSKYVGNMAVTIRIAEITGPDAPDADKYNQLQNMEYGMSLLEAGAKQGRVAAMLYLGTAEKDLDKALQWLQKAAERGFPRANVEMAKIYNKWFETTGENDAARSVAAAHSLYQFILDRQYIVAEEFRKTRNATLSTQLLNDKLLEEVRKNLRALEQEGRWVKQPNGKRQIVFDRDGTAVTLVPFDHRDNPYAKQDGSQDVELEMARAKDYETGRNGHIKRPAEAAYIYADLTKRRAGGELALPTEAQLKVITKAIDALAAQIGDNNIIVQQDGQRTLIFKGGDRKPDDAVFVGPSEKWLRDQARAAKAAAKPARPANDKKKKKGNDDKPGGTGT